MKMKRRALRILLCAAIAGGITCSSLATSENAAVTLNIKTALQSVVMPELPVKAASLVTQAKRSDKVATAVIAVREAIRISPALSVSIVSAVSKAEPRVAPEAALIAAGLQPENITAITKAAVVAAPKQVAKIVATLARTYPMSFDKIAIAATMGSPEAADIVWTSLTTALPGLKTLADQNLTRFERASAASPVTVTVTVSRITLNQVTAAVEALQAYLLATYTQSDLDAAGVPSSFQALATAILTGQIGVSTATEGANTVPVVTPGATFNSLATVTTKQGTTVADPGAAAKSSAESNPNVQSSATNSKNAIELVSGNTAVVTSSSVRKYSSTTN
jgi:hypothetical protein